MTATRTQTHPADQAPERPARRGWIRRHIPTVTPRPWLASVTGSPLAEAMNR
jgi:hypothetical protein